MYNILYFNSVFKLKYDRRIISLHDISRDC